MLDIATPDSGAVSVAKLAKRVDLSLVRSGENFCVSNLVEVARWGHFAAGDYPWEVLGRV